MREFLDNIATNFAAHADIEEVTSVDEQMVPFKGQLGFKVYMKNKPAKWGVKVSDTISLSLSLCLSFLCQSLCLPHFLTYFSKYSKIFRSGHLLDRAGTSIASEYLGTTSTS